MKILDIIQEIISFSPRQLENERKTADYLINFLNKENVNFVCEEFVVDIPLVRSAVLFADDHEIACEGNCFKSGDIISKDYIASSLIFDMEAHVDSLITYNPRCDEISLPVFYAMPTVSVSRDAIDVINHAEKVHGHVDVDQVKHRAVNILVGNRIDPRSICFVHYDSIKMGAIDNASGVAVMMEFIRTKKELLHDVLIVFSANEELSCDKNIYWGNGYREFERVHADLMKDVSRIIVIDSVGNGKAQKITDQSLLQLAFPITSLDGYSDKIICVSGDFDHLMTVYHSDADDGRGIKEEYLQDTLSVVCDILCKNF